MVWKRIRWIDSKGFYNGKESAEEEELVIGGMLINFAQSTISESFQTKKSS